MINVLVTGVGGPAGMAVVQSLKIAPERIRIIGADMNPLAPGFRISDESEIIPPCTSSTFIESVLDVCKKFKVDVVIPTVDEEISVFSANLELFKSRNFSIPIPSKWAVALARDKYLNSQFVNTGVLSPKTVLLGADTSLENALSVVGLPCVLKRRIGRGGRGFAIIESINDLRYWISKSRGEQQILQEKIDGDLLLVQAIAQDGKTFASIVHKRLETKTEGSGTAISAVTIQNDAAIHRLDILLRKLRWNGAVGVEFLLSNLDGELYMIDVNPRICGQSHLSTLAGMNLAYGLVELGTNRDISITKNYELGKAFVRVWRDEVFNYSELSQLRELA